MIKRDDRARDRWRKGTERNEIMDGTRRARERRRVREVYRGRFG